MFNPLKNNHMKMKVKSFMMLLALAGMTASCSNDDLTEGGDNGTTGTRPEIQIAFSGSGESQEYERNARAIASESENKIDQLSVYLFASASAAGPYYYLETWEEGTDYVPATPAVTKFKKQASGTGWKASIYPNELKGLPYVKLLCVANNGVPAGSTTDGNFYAEDGKTALAALVPVTVDDDGNITNAPAATTELAFKEAHTMNLGIDAATGIIATPLMMTGEGATKISGSVSKVNIDLRRIMARFDIDNTTSRSNLTIQHLTLARGRKCGEVFKTAAGLTPVAKDDLDKVEDANLLVKYQTVDFTAIQGANVGLTESALYAYPNLATDESYLIIEGTYKSPITSAQVPVTYNIPIARTPDGADAAQYIPIKANNRYKLRITDVTQSNIFGSFEVVDWTSGGGINVKPDNDAPIFAGDAAFTTGDKPIRLVDADHPEILNYEVATDADGNGSFEIEIAATGKVRAEKGAVARADDATAWFTIAQAGDAEERDGVWYTKFSVNYAGAIGQQPVAVTFINDAASYDPALWTVINFYGPKAKPAFAVVSNGNSKGNLTALTDSNPLKPTASIYKVKNSYVQFDITSIEGVKVAATGTATGFKAEFVKTEGFVHTYKVSVSDEATAVGGTIIFQNAADPTKETTLTVTALDPSVKFTEVTNTDLAVTWAPGAASPVYITAGELKIDLDALTTAYAFKLESPLGVTATNLNSCPWLTITSTHTWADADGERYDQFTVEAKAGTPASTDDFTMNFNSGLSETNIAAPGIAIKAHKDYSKPKLEAGTTTASWSTWNVGLGTPNFTDPYAATIDMYLVDNSAVTVKMTCAAEAATFETVDGLKVEQIGSTDEYIVKVDDATKFTAGSTTVLTAHNDAAYALDNSTDRKAKLTITWKSAAITATLTNDDGGTVTKSGTDTDIVYSMDAANLGAKFEFAVTANGGATTDLSVLTDSFLKAHTNNTGDATLEAGVAETYSFKTSDDTVKADIVMTFTNTVIGGGDLTITFKNTAP